MSSVSLLDGVAKGLGYLVGIASFSLYAPILIRIHCRKSETVQGLTISTWWLKVISYSCTLLYCYSHGYDLSTYIETLVISIEAGIILLLVFYYQQKQQQQPLHSKISFLTISILYILLLLLGLNGTLSEELISIGQAMATLLCTLAIVPQMIQNHLRKSSGDYSPITTILAILGNLVRTFTTIQLNNSDAMLLMTYVIPMTVYIMLLLQILYFGTVVEKQSLWEVLSSDVKTDTTPGSNNNDNDGNSFYSQTLNIDIDDGNDEPENDDNNHSLT